MGSVLRDSYETYKENLKLVLFFSIPFLIAFAIPLFAPLPTYISAGAIFLRTASISTNLSFSTLAVIIIAMFFSLLFLSFAFVAISLIVKSKRTHLRISRRVLNEIERYMGKVFLIFVAYTILILLANLVGFYTGYEELFTAIAGFVGFVFIFYAPSAIVVDDKRPLRAIENSVRLVAKEPFYFIEWLVLVTVIISVLEFVFIALTGTFWSRYIVLVISSLLVLPYFVMVQAEAYMKRFPILRH